MNSFIEYREAKKYQLAIRLAIITLAVFTVLAIAHLDESIENIVIFSSAIIICITVLYYVYKTKKYKPFYYVICSLAIAVSSIGLIFIPDVTHYTDFVWMLDGILLAFLGIGHRFGISLAIISIIIGVYFGLFQVNNHINTIVELDLIKKISLSVEIFGSIAIGTYTLLLILDFYNRSNLELQKNNYLLKEQNTQIQLQGDEKTVLIKEIHHRVKNNLQIVTSLLRMQSHELNNEESKKHFSEAINRIVAMSLVHEKLYQKDTLAQINLQDYVADLANDLVDIYNKKELISVETNCSIDFIGLKSIVPIGLLINELITNSLEHAFQDNEKGFININIEPEGSENMFLLSYSDSGIWDNKDVIKRNESTTFGLELIDMLTDQLDGKKELIISETGTTYNFILTNLDE